VNYLKKLFLATTLSANLGLYANDSTGYISTGGVEYFKNKNISMVSEDLYISKDKIRVAYEFHNDTDKDITETILFPLPTEPINIDGDWADVDVLHKSFKIWVNDKPVVYKKNIIHKTIKSGDDVFDKQVIYSWKQTFPANKSIKVKHEYTPLVGGSVSIGFSDKETKQNKIKYYCMDSKFLHALRGQSKEENMAPYYALGYILTTGANWAKPIEHFHLTIDKPERNIISLCWDSSLKKVSKTRFEATKTNFTPKHDIEIIFAYPYLPRY